MPRTTTELDRLLRGKFGFEYDAHREAGHTWYVLRIPGLSPIRTKLSHGRKEVTVESKIARQLRVRKAFYDGMMDCRHSRDDYVQQITMDPYPPFDKRIV